MERPKPGDRRPWRLERCAKYSGAVRLRVSVPVAASITLFPIGTMAQPSQRNANDTIKGRLLERTETPCVDLKPDCRFWAHTGECSRNRRWMSSSCAMSCGECLGPCHDEDDSCEGWADAGECEANERFMIERCPASCHVCPRISGRTLSCDSCLQVQEVLWQLLQPREPKTIGTKRYGPVPLVREVLRRAFAEVCRSLEWKKRSMTALYHMQCERIVSLHYDALVSSWIGILFAQGERVARRDMQINRTVVLQQKFALCATRPPRGFGMCTDRESNYLLLGQPLGDSRDDSNVHPTAMSNPDID